MRGRKPIILVFSLILVSIFLAAFFVQSASAGFMFFTLENHYAPEVGNIVMQKIWQSKAHYPDQPYFELKQELISTTYEP